MENTCWTDVSFWLLDGPGCGFQVPSPPRAPTPHQVVGRNDDMMPGRAQHSAQHSKGSIKTLTRKYFSFSFITVIIIITEGDTPTEEDKGT